MPPPFIQQVRLSQEATGRTGPDGVRLASSPGRLTNPSWRPTDPEVMYYRRTPSKSRSEIDAMIVSLNDAVRASKALIAFETKKVDDLTNAINALEAVRKNMDPTIKVEDEAEAEADVEVKNDTTSLEVIVAFLDRIVGPKQTAAPTIVKEKKLTKKRPSQLARASRSRVRWRRCHPGRAMRLQLEEISRCDRSLDVDHLQQMLRWETLAHIKVGRLSVLTTTEAPPRAWRSLATWGEGGAEWCEVSRRGPDTSPETLLLKLVRLEILEIHDELHEHLDVGGGVPSVLVPMVRNVQAAILISVVVESPSSGTPQRPRFRREV
ncbi:hypothetical protein QBC39DRAFT_331109 [Podospora conica]|nr:hypothetical protein QBC39DRAFT_331109 [Schizothecium conicum]